MDKAALVNIDIERGAEILQALDKANLNVEWFCGFICRNTTTGVWIWRPAVFDAVERREAYGLVHKAMDSVGFPIEHTPALLILPMTDPSIRDLRRIFGKTKSVAGMRLGGQMIGDRFIEDGYAYRIS